MEYAVFCPGMMNQIKSYISPVSNILTMLDAQQITLRFLETNLQVHPDVVRYIQEEDDPDLIERIIAQVPKETIVVSSKHLPGMNATRDGTGFYATRRLKWSAAARALPAALTEPRIIFSISGTVHPAGRDDPEPVQRDADGRVDTLSPVRQEECTVIGMVTEVKTTTNGHRIAELEDTSANITVLFRKDRPVFLDAERIIPDEVIGVKGKLSNDGKLFFADTLDRRISGSITSRLRARSREKLRSFRMSTWGATRFLPTAGTGSRTGLPILISPIS